MLVVKFGGTSVGKPERMKKIADLVVAMPGKKIVVLSALSKCVIKNYLLQQPHDY